MKKIIRIILMIFLISLLFSTISMAIFTANMTFDENPTSIEVGKNIKLKITTNETIVAFNCLINYDSSAFELVRSATQGLEVGITDGKVACIYADSQGIGTNSFEIEFKTIGQATGPTFSVENPKFRAVGQSESYTGDQISGLEPITIEIIEPAYDIRITYRDDLISGEKVVGIMVENTYTDRKITKDTLASYVEGMGTLTGTNGSIKTGSSLVMTGDTLEINGETYRVLVYGDANGDGTICDTDDIMVIIKDFIGTQPATGINRIAANLSNGDNILDTDDIMQIINRYLGTLTTDLVVNFPESNINNNLLENDIVVYLNGATSSQQGTPWGDSIFDEHYLYSYIRFITQTNYEIQFKFYKDDEKVEYSNHCIEDENRNLIDLIDNTWYTANDCIKGPIRIELNSYDGSTDSGKRVVSYRLYDSNTNTYSDEITITRGQLTSLPLNNYN